MSATLKLPTKRRKDLYFGAELEDRYANRRATQNPSAIINAMAARYQAMISSHLKRFTQEEIALAVDVIRDSHLINMPPGVIDNFPAFVMDYVIRNPDRKTDAGLSLLEPRGYADCLAIIEEAERIINLKENEV